MRIVASSLAGLAILVGCTFQRYQERPLDASRSATEFMERRLDTPGFAAFARAHLGPGAAFPPLVWGLDELVLAGCFHRSELDIARAELAAARGAVETAGARPNPRLALAPAVVPGATNPWILEWILELPLETAGKRGLRRDAAEARVAAAELALPRAAWRVRSEVRTAWLELGSSRARGAWLEQERSAREEHLRAQSARLAAGQLSSPELARDQQEFARVVAECEIGRTRIEHALAGLAAALGMPSASLEGVAIAAPMGAWPASPTAGAARDIGLLNRLDLHARLHEYAAAEADLRLEIARQYPDLSLGPGTSWDQGDHKYVLGLALELPLFAHNQGPIAEAEARRAASAARFLALQEEAIGAIERARVAYAGALRERESVRAGLELARLAEQRARRSLALGAAGRLEVLDAQLSSLHLERSLGEQDERVGIAQGELEDQLQRPLEPSSPPEPPAAVP